MEPSIRCFAELSVEKFDDEGVITYTSIEQKDVERTILEMFKTRERSVGRETEAAVHLRKREHAAWLRKLLMQLPAGYECLDASRPWLCYWILNALWLLNEMPSSDVLNNVVEFLSHCQHPEGGFGGGPGQMPHLAPTYAAINALAIIGTDAAYDSIDRSTLQKFLWTVREVDGSFAMHRGGEQDIRGAYCALSVAKLCNVYSDSLFDKTAEWIASCQTYEGGFAGYPGMEAHGGYAFCGIAALALMGRSNAVDINALLRWSSHRQTRLEGGFQGRTNKLVDSCYSFWQGGAFPIIAAILAKQDDEPDLLEEIFFNGSALRDYLLVCCQHPNGGMVDKPGKPRDAYHTCYALSGLSIVRAGSIGRLHAAHALAPHHVYNAVHYFIRHPPPVKD